jgi:RNA polymerase sigma-70 factor (ECF subfamily)
MGPIPVEKWEKIFPGLLGDGTLSLVMSRCGVSEPAATIDDSELMRRVQRGDFNAFTVLFRRYRSRLLGVAESRLRQREWAEDVVQETFLCAFKSRHTFRLEANFRTWLWTILFHQCHRHHHRRQRQPVGISDGEESQVLQLLVGQEPLPPEQAIARERRARLDEVLAQLNPAQADALRLRFFGELKFREIADTLECSLLTAKNRVKAGLLKMAELLDEPAFPAGPSVAQKELS